MSDVAAWTEGYDPGLSVDGRGEAVVLVPGMDGTGRLFYRQTGPLARSYRVATYALRNTARAMDQLVADLAQVVDLVDPVERRAIVVGESFGGALALSLALAHPGRVRALVILNSFPYFTPQTRLHLAMAGLRIMPWHTMGLVRRLTAFRLHSRHTHREERRRFMALTAGASRDGYIGRLRILTRYDVRARLGEIEAPTLFLAAEQDHLVPSVAQATFMAARVPGSVMRILAGHGHICLLAPDIDLERILREWRG
ncbi:MAG: alpha/beta fold hydrolase [Acidobacteriota bacterium]|nr:alpha/beta fold hydrolase [Acidobacteriota bacterium]